MFKLFTQLGRRPEKGYRSLRRLARKAGFRHERIDVEIDRLKVQAVDNLKAGMKDAARVAAQRISLLEQRKQKMERRAGVMEAWADRVEIANEDAQLESVLRQVSRETRMPMEPLTDAFARFGEVSEEVDEREELWRDAEHQEVYSAARMNDKSMTEESVYQELCAMAGLDQADASKKSETDAQADETRELRDRAEKLISQRES